MPGSHYSVEFETLRLKTGLSRAETADLLGVTELTVIRYENGQSRPSPIAIKWMQEHLANLSRGVVRASTLGSGIDWSNRADSPESARDRSVPASNKKSRKLIMRKVATDEKRTTKSASVMPLTLAKSVPSKSWELTVSSIGLESLLAQKSISALASLFEADAPNEIWLSLWEQHCCNYFDLAEADRLLEQYALSSKRRHLFFVQAYCKMVLVVVLERAGFHPAGASRPGFFDWLDSINANDGAAIKRK
jgi:transcriptional regulator with XRE-family HTH domain